MGKSGSKKRIPTPENIEAQKPASQIQMNAEPKAETPAQTRYLDHVAACKNCKITIRGKSAKFDHCQTGGALEALFILSEIAKRKSK